jgi:hypothetical protein
MSTNIFTSQQIKLAILKHLQTKYYGDDKYNIIGKEDAPIGAIETSLNIRFHSEQRHLASKCFDELRAEDLIRPTYGSNVRPEDWVVITDAGLEALERDSVDRLNTVSADIHLQRLKLLFIGANGSRRKALVLPKVFKNENMSESDTRKEADYMEGEGWIETLADNGPPRVRLTHEGIKKAQETSTVDSGITGISNIVDFYMNTGPKIDTQPPPGIQDSLRAFKADHPDTRKIAFVMMRFGNTSAHVNIMAGIQKALGPHGIIAVRADGKEYHDELLSNVQTYVYGCGFGIAVFERIETEEFNPNVALEVGYMFALKKPVCLLKDRTLKTLQADLMGKLYKVFDPLDPETTIPTELTRWLKDKELI